MLTKKYIKSRKIWKVTFELPRQEWPEFTLVERVELAGDFNGWDPSSSPMRLRGEAYQRTVELEGGRDYQFRYLVNGTRWHNDWHADAYVPNPAGGDNCVVRLPEQ
jgi:1,4-alpha-glucan branching enzyme